MFGKTHPLKSNMKFLSEIFVMDNQGANVCMSDKTSDDWQGDEAKFQASFAGGQGAIHVGAMPFDKSSQAYIWQISVPVKEGDRVIGAITFWVLARHVHVREEERTRAHPSGT